jgi:ribosome-associated toxin RatA of RatAB toxin-antitoxin module|tara:strand:- start:337 stop:768 length:432 start_codon:yes stop_codon:yes gene_type:complete
MHVIERSVLVPYSANQMFDLVADVEKYPEFMPWCGGSTVSHSDEHGMQASITIALAGVRQTFTTRNRHDYPNSIELSLIDGPFSDLVGHWSFVPITDEACRVVFNLKYSFSSRALQMVVGPIFNRIATSFIDSFTQRAEACYG